MRLCRLHVSGFARPQQWQENMVQASAGLLWIFWLGNGETDSEKDAQMITTENTEFGFKFGPVEVTRIASDQKTGWVSIQVHSEKEGLEIAVTADGHISVRHEPKRKRK